MTVYPFVCSHVSCVKTRLCGTNVCMSRSCLGAEIRCTSAEVACTVLSTGNGVLYSEGGKCGCVSRIRRNRTATTVGNHYNVVSLRNGMLVSFRRGCVRPVNRNRCLISCRGRSSGCCTAVVGEGNSVLVSSDVRCHDVCTFRGGITITRRGKG